MAKLIFTLIARIELLNNYKAEYKKYKKVNYRLKQRAAL